MTPEVLRRSELCTKETCPTCLGLGRQLDHPVVGRKMRELREAAGLRLGAVGKILGLSKQYLSGLECGKKTWTTELIERYATICCPPDKLD